MDLSGHGRLHAAAARSPFGVRPAAALGAPPAARAAYALQGPPGVYAAFDRARDTGESTETLRPFSGAAQGPSLGPGEGLPGHQKDRLNPPEPRSTTFCDGPDAHRKAPVLKTQA